MNIMKYLRNTLFVFILFVFSYTPRCDKITSKIFRLIKTHAPDYRLNVVWSNEKYARFYSHCLKLITSVFEKIEHLSCDPPDW